MLREIAPEKIRQYPDEAMRRWFLSKELDVTVWSNGNGEIVKFELCYVENWKQKALTWSESGGFRHENIDSGESIPGKPKQTPILYADGAFAKSRIIEQFTAQSAGLEPSLSCFIINKLECY